MRTAASAGALFALSTSLTSLPSMSIAGPADYIYEPAVEYGEREIDFKAGTAKLRGGESESAQSLGFGYGLTARWFTELYASWHQTPDEGTGFDAWEWENKFQLTETGQYPVDVGMILEIERPKNRAEGYEVRWGPLFQSDLTTNVQANFNVIFEKHYRAESASPATLFYQWQVKYREVRELEYGLQGFGELGPWDRWAPHSEQSHIAGPAIFGKFDLGARQVIKYNVGLLFGLNEAAPRTTLRLQTEYEF